MRRDWSIEDDETIIRMLGLGKHLADVAAHFGISKNAIIGRVHRLRKGFKKPAELTWDDERKGRFRASMIKLAEDAILQLLTHDRNLTAQEISELLRSSPAGKGWIWEALIKMEKAGLVWRAHHFDVNRANRWEITGCGRITQSAAAGQ